MPNPRRIRQIVAVIYAVTFAVYAVVLCVLVRGSGLATVVGLMTVGPAVMYLRGVRGSRVVLGSLSALLLVLWAFVPVAQHAVDRTTAFWSWWAFFGLVLAAGVVVSMGGRKAGSRE